MKKVNKEYLLNFIIVTFLLGIIIIPISVLVFSIPFFSIIGFQSLADNLNISSLITINWYSNNMFYNIGYIALFFIVTYLIFIFLELFIIFLHIKCKKKFNNIILFIFFITANMIVLNLIILKIFYNIHINLYFQIFIYSLCFYLLFTHKEIYKIFEENKSKK